MVEKFPGIGGEHDVIIPLVGECDDSWLNDIAGRHVKEQHVYEAISTASDGPVAEGNVGGGTGMITCDFKAGIGTSSRRLPESLGGYTVGVLVMSNFGVMRQLRVGGLPVGEILEERYGNMPRRERTYGSIIAVIATDAPLTSHQLSRLAKRAALGIGRVGSSAMHGSGEIVLAFSTANMVPRETRKMVYRLKILLDERLDPLYEAVIEATEEAILNALCQARDLDGVNGNVARALPISEVKELATAWQRLVEGGRRAAGQKKAAPPAPPPTGSERRDGGAVVTPAVARPTAVRGAEGMAPPARPAPPKAEERPEPAKDAAKPDGG
jgi:D-aminopeptidase